MKIGPAWLQGPLDLFDLRWQWLASSHKLPTWFDVHLMHCLICMAFAA